MMLGREIRLPVDTFVGPPPEEEHRIVVSSEYVQSLMESMQSAHATVRDRLGSHYRYQKLMYDRDVHIEIFYVGQAVWLRNFPQTKEKSKKLMPIFSGPCIVVKKGCAVTYVIVCKDGTRKCVHGDRLKRYYGKVHEPRLMRLWVPWDKRPKDHSPDKGSES